MHFYKRLFQYIAMLGSLLFCCQLNSLSVVNTYPHNPAHFTQGLIIDDGVMIETTGLFNKSQLLTYPVGSISRTPLIKLKNTQFGEGITRFGNTLYWLTWRNGVVHLIDTETFRIKQTISYNDEGWGLTHNGKALIMSNGTPQLSFRDPKSFKLIRKLKVHYQQQAVSGLNELEWINGAIYANIWQRDLIAKINPVTGEVIEMYDLSFLRNYAIGEHAQVLNGIAYDQATNKLYVTGKQWALLFELTD